MQGILWFGRRLGIRKRVEMAKVKGWANRVRSEFAGDFLMVLATFWVFFFFGLVVFVFL